MEAYFEIGKIVNTQGIKGDVRIYPMTDDVTRFELLDAVTIDRRGRREQLHIERVWYHKQFVIIKFKEIHNMTEAEAYKEAMILIPPEMALPLEDGEYYIRDLLHMAVVTEEGEDLGLLTDIIKTGANDVYVVQKEDKELLIPAIPVCILHVDVPGKRMTVHLLPGLREV